MTDISNYLHNISVKVKSEQVSASEKLANDIGELTLRESLLKSKMNEIGLNRQQMVYLLNDGIKRMDFDSDGQMKHKGNFSDKFYEVLDKLNVAKKSALVEMSPSEISKRISENIRNQCLEATPVKARLQSLTHTLEYLNNENHKLRCELAANDSQNSTPDAIEMAKMLEIEQHEEHEKLGVMSHEYEQKIMRLQKEDAEIAEQLQRHINKLLERNNFLFSKLSEANKTTEILEEMLKVKDKRLAKEIIENGMMLEKANEQFRELSRLLNQSSQINSQQIDVIHQEQISVEGDFLNEVCQIQPSAPLFQSEIIQRQNPLRVSSPPVSGFYQSYSVVEISKTTTTPIQGLSNSMGQTTSLNQTLEEQLNNVMHQNEKLEQDCLNFQRNLKFTVENYERKITELKQSKNTLSSSQSTTHSNPLVHNPPFRLSYQPSCDFDQQSKEVLELKEKVKNYEVKIEHLESSLASLENKSKSEDKLLTPRPILVFDEVQHYLFEIQRLKDLANELNNLKDSQAAENKRLKDELSRLVLKIHAIDSQRQRAVTRELQEGSELRKLRADIKRLQDQHDIDQKELVPKSLMQSEIKVYLGQISNLTKTIGQLDKQLEDQARELWEIRTEKGKFTKRIELLEERIDELEKEEEGCLEDNESKQAELKMLKAVLIATKTKKDKALEELAADEQVIEAMQRASLQKNEQIALLSEKIQHLETVPHGVPVEVVKKHLFMIGELAKRASSAEDKLQEQRLQLQKIKEEEQTHHKDIISLNRKLKEIQSEVATSKSEIEAKDKKIASYKNLLSDTSKRLETLTSENQILNEENRKDIKMINESMSDSNKHLLEIGLLAQMVRQLNSEKQSLVSQDEVNKYVTAVADLRSLLSRAEGNLMQKSAMVDKLEDLGDRMGRQIVELNQQIHRLEIENKQTFEDNTEKDQQLSCLKEALDLALTKLQLDDIKLIEDAGQIERYELDSDCYREECEKRAQTIQILKRKVVELEFERQKSKDVIESLKKKIEEKSEHTLEIEKEEKELKAQLKTLSRKCKMIESQEQLKEKEVKEAEQQLLEYKQLFKETANKYQELALKSATVEQCLMADEKKMYEIEQSSTIEIAYLRDRIAELESIPKGVPQEEVEQHLHKINELATKLNIAEQKANEASRRLNMAVREEDEAIRMVVILDEKVKNLELATELVSELERDAYEKEVLRYKALLLTATERMRDLGKENSEIKSEHRKDVGFVEQVLAETNTKLMELHTLTKKLNLIESECAETKQKMNEYQAKVRDLTEKLSITERQKMDKETVLHQFEAKTAKSERMISTLSQENKSMSAQMAVIHKKLYDAEHNSYKQENHALTVRLSQMNDRIKELEAKNSELSKRLSEVIEHMTPTTAAKYMPESMLKDAKTDLAINQDDEADYAPDSSKLLKKKLDSVQKELQSLRVKVTMISPRILEQHKTQNKELSAKVRSLEAQLKTRDKLNKEKNQTAKKLSRNLETLEQRIAKLEQEKAQTDGALSSKEKEIKTLKRLVDETKGELEETVMINHALSIQQQKTAEKQASLAMNRDAQINEMQNLKEKIAELSTMKKGVPEDIYEDKITVINGLYAQLVLDEAVIRKQTEELQSTKDQVSRLMSTVVVLSDKIRSLELEEDVEERFIQDRNCQISSLKETLRDTVEHLKAIADKNFELECQHEADHQKQRETLAKMNTCLIGMTLIARQNKKLEMESKDEANRYLNMINELTENLMTAEKKLEQRGIILAKTSQADKAHSDQVIRLSQRVAELEAEEAQIIEEAGEQSDELIATKKQLEEALNRANIREDQIEEMKDAVLEDCALLNWFEEETERYGQTLASLASEVQKVKSEPRTLPIDQVNRYLKHISSLSQMLKDTEQALMIKDQELKGEVEVEKMHVKHARLLQSKIKELEVMHDHDIEALNNKEKDLLFYRKLLKNTNDKLMKELTDRSPVKMPRDNQHRSELSELSKRIGQIPDSIESELLNNYLDAVNIVIEKLQSSRNRLSSQSQRIEELQVLKEHQLEEIDVLTERMMDLQMERDSTCLEATKYSEKFGNLKNMLEDTTKRLEATVNENAQLRTMNRLEVETIQEKVDESSLQLLQISNLVEKVKALKRENRAEHDQELAEYMCQVESMASQLDQARDALQTEIEIVETIHESDVGQQEIMAKLFDRVKQLETEEEVKEETIHQKQNELDTLKAILDDTIGNLKQQAEGKEKFKLALNEEKSKFAQEIEKEELLIRSKDEKIKFLEDSVAAFAKEMTRMSESEYGSKNMIRNLTHKISELEKDQQQNIGAYEENKSEIEMYMNMLEDWKDKLERQSHINATFKNKVIEEGQILAMRSSMWPASQFNLLLYNIQRLEHVPEELSKSELNNFVPEATSLMTDLVIQEEEFLSRYHKLNTKLKQETSLAADALNTVINECSPTRNNGRCMVMAREALVEISELALQLQNDIDQERAGLNEEGDKILVILEKIGACLAHIAIAIEDSEQRRTSEGDNLNLKVYLSTVDSLSSKIENVTCTFKEAFESNKHRVNRRMNSSKIEEVQALLEKITSLDLQEGSTPRPDSSISNNKSQAELKELISAAEAIKESLAKEIHPEMRPYELVGVLTQRITHMEEEKRANHKLSLRSKIQVIRLFMSVLEQDSHSAPTAGKELQELITELEIIAELYLAEAFVRDPTTYRSQMTKVELAINKYETSGTMRPESENLIRRLRSDINRLQSFQVKYGSILISDMLEGAVTLLEDRIRKLNNIHCSVLNQRSAIQDEHLQAREWDSKKIDEQRNAIEDLRDILFIREAQLKESFILIDKLSNKITQLKDQVYKSESSQLNVYGDQISIMRQRITQLEDELQTARGQSKSAVQVQSEDSVHQQNESLINRLHKADQSLNALSQLNHQYEEQIRSLSHKIEENNMASRQRQHYEDKIVQLQGEIALLKHRGGFNEHKLKGKISQLLHAVYVLRLAVQKKQAIRVNSDDSQPQGTQLIESNNDMVNPREKFILVDDASKSLNDHLQANEHVRPDIVNRQ